jgi:hypothetical protein
VRAARFKVVSPRLDGAGGATVTIDRATGVVEVRPLRRHYVATVTLAWVAEAALWRRAKVLAAEKRAKKKRKAS